MIGGRHGRYSQLFGTWLLLMLLLDRIFQKGRQISAGCYWCEGSLAVRLAATGSFFTERKGPSKAIQNSFGAFRCLKSRTIGRFDNHLLILFWLLLLLWWWTGIIFWLLRWTGIRIVTTSSTTRAHQSLRQRPSYHTGSRSPPRWSRESTPLTRWSVVVRMSTHGRFANNKRNRTCRHGRW